MHGEWTGGLVGPDVWVTCRELIPAGSVFAFLAGQRQDLFPASMAADMDPSGFDRPSMPPQVLAPTRRGHCGTMGWAEPSRGG